jgi:tRNA(fMet)-specific endonuclease VapC
VQPIEQLPAAGIRQGAENGVLAHPQGANIRAWLERAGTPIGPYDILIAAQARRRKAILITANREFGRVPGLATQDWSIA